MQYPVEVPGVSVTNFLRTAVTAVTGEAPKLRTWTKELNAAFEQLVDRSVVPAALDQRGLLRRREEALRGAPARAAQAEDRGPRRDRLRPRRRRAADRVGRGQPGPRGRRDRHAADHALHADPALHRARLRPRLRRRQDRRRRRPGARRRARGRGLREVDRDDDDATTSRWSARTSRSSSGRSGPAYRWSTSTAPRPSQKPLRVLDAMRDYNERHNANVHRGIHTLAEEATALYEGARDKVAAFIGATDRREVVFAKNSTEALNLMAHVLPFGPGDEVVITEMEHHSNIVPWQLACERTRRHAEVDRPHRRRPARPVQPRRAHHRPHQGRGRRPPVQPAGHRQPGHRDRRAGARGRCRSSSSTARSRSRTCRSTWHRSASTRSLSPGTRCAARPGSARCGRGSTCSSRCRRSSAAAR